MNARGGRYLWQGHVLYVTKLCGKWVAAYDGPCGERSFLMNSDLMPAKSREEMQRALDFWADKEGLEAWRG